jgi:hypothetical protein
MPVVMTAMIPDATTDMYDRLNEEMGFSADNLPSGLISHYAAWTGDGLLIFDVWDTRDEFEAFAAERLAPAMEKLTGQAGSGIRPKLGDLYNDVHR